MDATVIKLIIMLALALLVSLGAIGLEVRTHQASLVHTGTKSALAVVLVALLISLV